MKNLVHGIKEKTPMGFCDVPRKNLLDFLRDMKSISVPNEPRYKPLKKIHQAASEGDAEKLQRMINLGKHSVHDRDFKQRTALHFACAYGQKEIVSVLLRNNCDIDAVDRNSMTPLMKAVQNWTYGCVCELLKHGADPNLMDKNGNTSLHYAVSEDNQTLAKCLLKYSADMEQKNKDGFTPLLLALKENKMEMAKFLVKKGANIHVFDEMKRNTLLYAIRWDSKDMVSLLLNEGIDFFFKDIFGWTALRYAIEGTSKGSRGILMDYDEKLRIKNKDASRGKVYDNENKNSEDNPLAKYHNNPPSGSAFHKLHEDDGDFYDKLHSSKDAPAKCPSNLCMAGDQRDENEAKESVEDSSIKHPPSKPVAKRANSVAHEESVSDQEESTHAETDIFTTESLEENVSDESENIQPLQDEDLLSGKIGKRGQNAKRQIKGQVWIYPTLKCSLEGKVPILDEVRKTAESHNFIIESDLEIESIEETLSDDSEDNQSLSNDWHFSETDENSQKDTSRQTTGQVWMFPNLKSSTEEKIPITNEARNMAKSHDFLRDSELEVEFLEKTQSSDSEHKQPLYLPQIDDGHFNGAVNERSENGEDEQIKESAVKYPNLKTLNEDPIPMKYLDVRDEETKISEPNAKYTLEEGQKFPDARGQEHPLQPGPMGIVNLFTVKDQREENMGITQEKGCLKEQASGLTLEEKLKKEDSSENNQCLNIFKLFRPKRIGSLFVTRDKSEENTVNAEEKETPKEYFQQKSATEEDSILNDSPAKKNAKSSEIESAIMLMCEKGQKCQLDSEKNNQWVSQPNMTSYLPVIEGKSGEITIDSQGKALINHVDSQQDPDIKLTVEEQKISDNCGKSQNEHMFRQPQPRGSAHVYFGKYQRGQNTLKVEKKDSSEEYSQCKATTEKKESDSNEKSSMKDVKSPCTDSHKEHSEWKPTMEKMEFVQKEASAMKYFQFREEADLKIKTEEEFDGDVSSQSSDVFIHIQPRYIPQLSFGLTPTPTNILNGGKGFQKKFPEWKPPMEIKDLDPPEASAVMHGQGFLRDADLKLETESEDYTEISENTQSSNTNTCLQSKCVPHLSGGLISRSMNLLIEEGKETVLQLKMENPKNLDDNENIHSPDSVTHIVTRYSPHLSTGLSPRPMNVPNEEGRGFQKKYPEWKVPIDLKDSNSVEALSKAHGKEFPTEAYLQMTTEEILDGNENIQLSDTPMQPNQIPHVSIGPTQRSMDFLSEGGKGFCVRYRQWKPPIEKKDSVPTEASPAVKCGQDFSAEADLKMKAEEFQKNLDDNESVQSCNSFMCLQPRPSPYLSLGLTQKPMNLINEGGKEVDIQIKADNIKNFDENESTQSSDNTMYLQPRQFLDSSIGLNPKFIDLNGREETDLQMKSELNQKHMDGNESIQSSDTLKHLQPSRFRHLLMGLIPRPRNIISRRGKESHKKYPPLKDSTDANTKLERKEIQTFKPVILEDNQDTHDGRKNNQQLVAANRKKRTSNEKKEDTSRSYGCVASSAAPDVSEASVVAAIVAAAVVAAATPAAAAAAASAAVAAVTAASAPAAAAAASATAAVHALAAVAPSVAPDSSAVPVAAATAATAAAVPAATAAAPDTTPAMIAAAAAAAAAATATVTVASVASVSLTTASSSVAAIVAAAVSAAAGSDAPTVAPTAAAAVAAVAAATGPAAAAALVASVAAATACVPPPATASPSGPSIVAAATAAAAAVATQAAASPAVAAAAAAAAAVAAAVPPGAPAVAAVAAATNPPDAPAAATAAAITKTLVLQRKYVEARKQQPPVEEAEEHDGDKKKISEEKVKVLEPVKDTHDLNALTPVTESCSAEYSGSSLKSTPVFDSYKELVELKEINVQILTEKSKVENELSEVKEENSQLEKKLVRKKERIGNLRSIIKEQVEKKKNIICAYNEIVEELKETEETIERREQYNRRVTETHELELYLKTGDVELKQLKKEKEHAQKMEDHLQMLELENTSLIATVKKQKEEIEDLQRHLNDTHKDLAQSPNLAETAVQENKNICKKHATVITEMENKIKSLKSEVSNVKTSKESSKKELEKYKRYYLEELRNKNFLLYELNRNNDSQEESHTKFHMKFEQNISSSNTLNTKLVHKCSCVEKSHQLENEHGENLMAPSSTTGSSPACMEHYPWMSENDMRELSKGLSDLKQSMQLSLETQKKQNSDMGKELVGIGKPFKIINNEHEIGECGSHGDFKTCQFGMSAPVSILQCSEQGTTKPYSEVLRESYTTSTINAMETKIRNLKSTLSRLKVSRALSVLELERYKYLYNEELSIRKSFQYYLNKNNKNLEKNRTKFHMDVQHNISAVNAQSLRPFTESSSAGYFDNIPGARISLLPRENVTASFSNSRHQPAAWKTAWEWKQLSLNRQSDSVCRGLCCEA